MQGVDICVLTAGRYDLLTECLGSIADLEGLAGSKVYVWDQNPDKSQRKTAKDLFKHPIIYRERYSFPNRGYAEGANSVIRMGSEPLVLFVSDDVWLEPEALHPLVETMKADTKIALCGLKLLFASGPEAGKVQHVGHTMTIRGKVIHPFLGWSPENPKTCLSGERISVTGATFMVRRNAFERVGGFSSAYGAGYYEDVELALQLKAAGYKIWVDCNALGHHHVGATFTTHKERFNSPIPVADNERLFVTRNQSRMVWTDWMIR